MAIQTLADIRRLESVPLAQRGLPASTYAALQAQADKTPAAPALSFFLDAEHFTQAQCWSYAQLLAEITRTANALHDLGIGARDVVAFLLPNLPETHFVIWGGEAAGIVMAINPLLEAAQIGELLRAANAKVVVCLAPAPDSDPWAKLAGQLDTLPSVEQLIWVSLTPYVNQAQAAALGALEDAERARHPRLRIHKLRELLAEQPTDHLKSERQIGAEQISSYFCTGGTTGLPKIATRTHGCELFDAWSVSQSLQPQPAGQVYFCGLPLFHVNGQLVTGLVPWLQGGHVLIGTPQGYRNKGLLANFWAMVEHYRVNFFSGVPTIFAALLQVPLADRDIASLQYAMCGAAPLPVELFRSFEHLTGVRILEGYGLTEGACVSSLNPPTGERRVGSIGLRLAYQDMRAVILDDQGHYQRAARTDEVGSIAICGPNLFAGYLDARHNRDIWLQIDGQHWLNSGDLGRQDAEGYFWLTGRKKELIIRSGHNIDPKQIEEALQAHPAVALVAAVGAPDAYAGEVPVAYVQLRPGASATAEELLSFAAQHIPERAAVPKRIEILAALPVTAVGKLFKPALQQREIAAVVRLEAAQNGLPDVRVEVLQDARRGLVAQITAGPQRDRLAALLGRYSFQIDWLD